MPARLEGSAFHIHYEIIDIRDIEAERLLDTPHTADHVLAILAKQTDGVNNIRPILHKLAKLDGEERKTAFEKLFVLAGLRSLGGAVRREAKRMPVFEDILTHDVLGPTFQEGRKEGQVDLLRLQIKQRFGRLAARFDKQLAEMPAAELERVSLRLFETESVEELFGG